MNDLKSWHSFFFFAKAYPGRSFFMVVALLVAAFLEGVGIVALLPLVTTIISPGAASSGLIYSMINQTFEFLHLSPTIGPMLLLIVAAILLKSIITMMALSQAAYATAHVCTDLRLSFLRNLLNAKWEHFVGLRSGTSANALGTEAQRAAMTYRQGCYVVAWGIQVIVYAVIAFMVSWKLTLAAIVAGSIMVFCLSFFVGSGRRAGGEQTKILNIVLARITDALYGAKPLKVMGKTDILYRMMEKETLQLQVSQRRMEISIYAMQVFSEPIMIIFLSIGMYGILTYGHLPVSELLFMAVLFLRMVMRVANVQTAYLTMAANESALWAVLDKIEKAVSQKDLLNGIIKPTLNQEIRIENLSFSYGQKNILNHANLVLPVKGFCVIFGPSGEGKTTFLDLITGLYVPTEGSIFIDGQAIQSLDIAEWRTLIGYVPQDVLLFHDTIRNNLSLNDPHISEDQIMKALKAADAWSFIEQLDDGLEMIVGERGSKLSGGQRQRIAIARALLQNPKLLIFDEATSALDKKTEHEILNIVKKLSENILVLSIAHNPATLVYADHVFRLQHGQLVAMSADEIQKLAA